MGYINNWLAHWDYLLLLLLRVSALIFSSPIFGRRNIPVIARIGYCACIAYLFFVSVPQTQPLDYHDDLMLYVLLCVKELLFGLVLGYVLNAFFTLTFTAGQLIDMQMGFGLVNVFDPQSNLSIPMVGNFLNIVMLLVFFAVNGHHRLIQILYLTVVRIPIGSVEFSPSLALVAVELFSQTFLLALSVALPIVVSGLMGEALMGVITRSVPQINVFMIGLPLKVVLGFVILLATLPVYVNFLPQIFEQMYIGLDNMFGALMGG
jgi:flagellar biosynthetic protein FliR